MEQTTIPSEERSPGLSAEESPESNSATPPQALLSAEILDDDQAKKEAQTNTITDEQKEQYFVQKIKECEKEYSMILNAEHEGFKSRCAELEQTKKNRIDVAVITKDLQLKSLENEHDAQLSQLKNEWEEEKHNIRERLVYDIQRKIKLLEEERDRTILLLAQHTGVVNKRTLDIPDEIHPNKKASFTVNLREEEVDEDIKLLRRVTSRNRKHRTPAP